MTTPTGRKILDLMNGSSSQKPMSFSDLLDKSGLIDLTLDVLLDNLYENRAINQATVTKNNVTQRVVWPTGVLPKFNSAALKSKTYQQRHVSLRELEKQKHLTEEKETEVAGIEDWQYEQKKSDKPRTLQVLEYIEAHPDCMGAEVVDAFNFINPISYLKLHIKNKKVIRTDILGKRKGFTLRLAKGCTAKDIYAGGVKNRSGRPKSTEAKPRERFEDPIHDDVPTFLSEQQQVEENEIAVELLSEKEPASAIAEAFRASYTSDDCMVISIDDMDFELDQNQTKQLIRFVEKVRMFA